MELSLDEEFEKSGGMNPLIYYCLTPHFLIVL